eukprot:gene20054-26034_t
MSVNPYYANLKTSEFFESVEDFVAYSGGDHAIKKILIANNGIGAIKAIRSIRRWSYETFGYDRTIQFVVMATPDDLRANAEYIRMADEVVDVPGGTNNNNYANVTLICDIAERLKVDAVMPLWGHASENPSLPTSLLRLKHKVTFIGPPAEPMMALGDKIGSTIIAQSAGVPTIAWNGDSLTVDYKKEGIPQEIYDKANVITAEDCLACCERIGYPVMIKASEGGGGKGIRKVTRSEDVFNSFRAVQGEIPGSPIFVMKMASNARHLEVQLIADKYGEAIALSGRDCSVQRRHQKIIEEGPPTAAPINVFKKMEKAAVALAKTVGYRNAGTVEYLYIESTQEYAFLELNPRLQVEHPVTENILGINLPACQLQVAMGLPLYAIGDVRKIYGRHPRGKDTIDFELSERQVPPRHCIAVRVTAENPESGFQPTSGKIQELSFRSAIDVWGYFSVNSSGLIHEFADSQFGHIFAGGPDRETARRAMIVALKELQIRGEIRTTIEYIIKMLQSKDFVENNIDTMWLDARIANHKELSAIENAIHAPSLTLVATAGAALQGYQLFLNNGKEFVDMLGFGHVPSKDILSPIANIDLIFNNTKFITKAIYTGPNSVVLECNNSKQSINIRTLADGGFLLDINGKNHLVYSTNESGGSIRMILDGHTCIFTPEYDPTKLRSSVAGKLARLLVPDGSHVVAGDPFVEIEVMKMYMPLKALEPGTVHFQMSEGATLSPGDIIATVVLDDPDKVVQAEIFTQSLVSSTDIAVEKVVKPHVVLRSSRQTIERVLEGYSLTETEISEAISVYISSFIDNSLPSYEIEEYLSVLKGRIDADLFTTIANLNSRYVESLNSDSPIDFPSIEILTSLKDYSSIIPSDKRLAFYNQLSGIYTTAEFYLFSPEVRTLAGLLKLIETYLSVEKWFDGMSFTDVVTELRKEYSGSLTTVLSLCRSHINIKLKNLIIIRVLDEIKGYPLSNIMQQRPKIPTGITISNEINLRNLKIRLNDLAKLKLQVNSHVSFIANLLLIEHYTNSTDSRRQKLESAVNEALTTGEAIGQGDRTLIMKKFVNSNIIIRDLLLDSLKNDSDYQLAVLEVYCRKIYNRTHRLKSLTAEKSLSNDDIGKNIPYLKFEFVTKSFDGVHGDSSPRQNERKRNISYNDLTGITRTNSNPNTRLSTSPSGDGLENLNHPIVPGIRTGVFVTLENLNNIKEILPSIINKIPEIKNNGNKVELVNAIHVFVLTGFDSLSDDDGASILTDYLTVHADQLKRRGVRRVTFFVGQTVKKTSLSAKHPTEKATIYTFRARLGYQEDRLFRHIEAPHAFHLDLLRLSNFNITLQDGVQTTAGNVHLYRAIPKGSTNGSVRFFARLVSFSADVQTGDLETLFLETLDHLSIAIGKEEAVNKDYRSKGAANHIFVNIINPDAIMQPNVFELEISHLWNKYWYKLVRLSVNTVEVKVACRLAVDGEPVALRFIASNPTGFVLKLHQYFEAQVGSQTVFRSVGDIEGPLEGLPTQTPYEIFQKFEKQRAEAMTSSDTLYVYDWPLLFESAAETQWKDYLKLNQISKDINIENDSEISNIPEDIFTYQELVICDSTSKEPLLRYNSTEAEKGVILPVIREPGYNSAGMVAWLAKLKSPEFPNGREFVIISNDITHQAGSFGTKEDVIFYKASEYARIRGIPRIFIAANSGARIGMAESLKKLFKVAFTDENDPSKGFKFIYINKHDYDTLLARFKDIASLPVIVSPTSLTNGEEVYQITDIIGEESDLGVENLMGSGLIAGETSRAYDDIFTLTMTRNSPIILTGYQALNKLMGREIYTTNDQLGGPMIMFPNGVSHLLADTHYDSVKKALTWLSFIPASKGSPLPIRDISGFDTIDRIVEFAPPKGLSYDPRHLLAGVTSDSTWTSGFFDKDSFVEALGGWAKTVVVGRGRLGGIPLGVIVTENRTSEAFKPADPADTTSHERMVQQAGGVWFPDSAYKTAQALKDFNREDLPCIIFANWRGFSGGQRDMFDEVLKFGSMIVDALVAYQQPLFVYIPPFAELRGGAWVVVDSTINSDVMEFYAAEDARGGVLEAAGAATIKFREKDVIATAHRLDHQLIGLDKQLKDSKDANDDSTVDQIIKQIKKREKALFGVYQQIAVHFADLHDTPGRMKAKGVIRQQVDWAKSRKYFFWRLRRRLAEFDIANSVIKSTNSTNKAGLRKEIIDKLKSHYLTNNSIEDYDNDEQFINWLTTNQSAVNSFRDTHIVSKVVHDIGVQFSKLVNISNKNSDTKDVIINSFKTLLLNIPEDQRVKVQDFIKESFNI